MFCNNMGIIPLIVVVSVLLLAVVVAALPSSHAQMMYNIDIRIGATNRGDQAYSPSPLYLQVGERVTWTNLDTAAHTVTSGFADRDTGTIFDSKVMGPGKQFIYQFGNEGIFDYFCMLHPTMRGIVEVKDGSQAPPATPSISVSTDKPSYKGDEDIRVLFRTDSSQGMPIVLTLLNPNGEVLWVQRSGIPAWSSVIIASDFRLSGVYKITVTTDYSSAETTFAYESIVSRSEQPSPSSDTPAEGLSNIEIIKGATTMKDKAFSPSFIKVQPGTMVTWINGDTAAHTVTSGTASNPTKDFDSKIMGPKKVYSFVFTTEGTFDYFCMLHPTMVGKTVVDRNAPSVAGSNPEAARQPAEEPAYSSYEEEPEQVARVVDFGITATSITKAKSTSFTVKNLSEGGVSAYEFTVILPEDSAVKRAKAPRGWTSEIIDNTIIFSTEGRPLDEGRKLGFRIYASAAVSDFDWQIYDENGDLLKEGSTHVRVAR